uniref:Putative secreted protein n=1 Tax=Ixodes ricinus TaxID=34613 RepID=A0A6B0UYB6_IXORI
MEVCGGAFSWWRMWLCPVTASPPAVVWSAGGEADSDGLDLGLEQPPRPAASQGLEVPASRGGGQPQAPRAESPRVPHHPPGRHLPPAAAQQPALRAARSRHRGVHRPQDEGGERGVIFQLHAAGTRGQRGYSALSRRDAQLRTLTQFRPLFDQRGLGPFRRTVSSTGFLFFLYC